MLGIRWTVGDVSLQGFEALRLSIWGAFRLFGFRADYVVCVNSIPLEEARRRAGELPPNVSWLLVTKANLPRGLRDRFDSGFAEGVGWKFAPLRLFPDRHELALDNDCILWEVPEALRAWLGSTKGRLIAEDVRPGFGRFASRCGTSPRNSGIRGLPPRFDLERAFARVLDRDPAPLTSELDEQGLQVAALSLDGEPLVVRETEVRICSPFPPHHDDLGSHGAHFVGLNARAVPWQHEGRFGHEHLRDHWARHRPELHARVGISLDGSAT